MKKILLLLLPVVLIFTVLSLAGCLGIASVKEIEVDSSNPEGVKFIAPASGSYEITIIGGSYCYLPQDDPDWPVYGGWRTMLHIYINKPVEWGEPGEWGSSPVNFDSTIGPDKSASTVTEAESAGKGSSMTVQLDKGDYVILLVYDGSDYYFDNSGTVRVRITRL